MAKGYNLCSLEFMLCFELLRHDYFEFQSCANHLRVA